MSEPTEMSHDEVLLARLFETGGRASFSIEHGTNVTLPDSGFHEIRKPVPKEDLPWNQEIRGENWVLVRNGD